MAAEPTRRLIFDPADLAPGDEKSTQFDASGLTIHPVADAADPFFAPAYQQLWQEFGAPGELEPTETLAARLRWNPASPVNGCALLYELLYLEAHAQFAAVRDHTAILPAGADQVFVHLSHLLVAPNWRRTGLAGWMRALPLQTARACWRGAQRSGPAPITLVAEMELPAPDHPERLIRLKAYERAGFRKVDPRVTPYLQPDFRPPAEIDATGGARPLPFSLLIRQVDREAAGEISGRQLRAMVEALYAMYATGLRPRDLEPVFANLDRFPAADARVPLVPPTA